MNLFELVLYQSCNYSCKDCPMAKWLYKEDAADEKGRKYNAISKEILFQWVDKYLDPKEWFIDITGGEPGMHPDIHSIIVGLASHRGYYGLIRTNGSLAIPGLPRMKRVATWHKGHIVPKYYDFINILQNTEDNWEEKVKYCKNNNIPYNISPYRYYSLPEEKRCNEQRISKTPSRIFHKMTTMFSSGVLGGCSVSRDTGLNLQNMDMPINFNIKDGCRFCPTITGIENLIFDIPGFSEKVEITERDSSFESLVNYPILNIQSEWVGKTGKIYGKLGDDLEEIIRRYKAEEVS